MKDSKLLISSTLRVYKESLMTAGKSLAANWWLPLLCFAYLAVMAIAVPVASIFGGLVAGFLLFGISCFLLAHFLAAIEVALPARKLGAKNLLSLCWSRTLPIFLNLVSIFFAFFVIQLLLSYLPMGSYLLFAFSITVAVLGNPLPELSYQGRGSNYELFAESFEFVKENVVEWFLPQLLFALIVFLLVGVPLNPASLSSNAATEPSVYPTRPFCLAAGDAQSEHRYSCHCSLLLRDFSLHALPRLLILPVVGVFKAQTNLQRKRILGMGTDSTTSNNKVLGVIPVRMSSTRLPGKPLADIAGQTLVERVWRQASQAKKVDRLIVATDGEDIAATAREFGAEVVMTSADCENGSARVAEVVRKSSEQYQIAVNIQGDMPFIRPEIIDSTIERMRSGINDCDMATVATPINRRRSLCQQQRRQGRHSRIRSCPLFHPSCRSP